MKSFEYTITDEVGIHARPAGLLVKEAKNYDSVIKVTKDHIPAFALHDCLNNGLLIILILLFYYFIKMFF